MSQLLARTTPAGFFEKIGKTIGFKREEILELIAREAAKYVLLPTFYAALTYVHRAHGAGPHRFQGLKHGRKHGHKGGKHGGKYEHKVGKHGHKHGAKLANKHGSKAHAARAPIGLTNIQGPTTTTADDILAPFRAGFGAPVPTQSAAAAPATTQGPIGLTDVFIPGFSHPFLKREDSEMLVRQTQAGAADPDTPIGLTDVVIPGFLHPFLKREDSEMLARQTQAGAADADAPIGLTDVVIPGFSHPFLRRGGSTISARQTQAGAADPDAPIGLTDVEGPRTITANDLPAALRAGFGAGHGSGTRPNFKAATAGFQEKLADRDVIQALAVALKREMLERSISDLD